MVLLEEFQALIQQAGGRLVGESYYGVWEGFPFTAYVEKIREPGEVSFHFRLPGTLQKWLLKELRRTLPYGCVLRAEARGRFAILCKGGPLRASRETLGGVLSLFTERLRSVQRTPPVCPLCRQARCDAYADLDGYVPVHRDCVEAASSGAGWQAEAPSGSVFAGVCGAVLGGLAVAVGMLAALAVGWLVRWFYFFLPVAAMYGYRCFRKRAGGGARFCAIVVSVGWVFVIEQAIFYMFIHIRYDIWPSIVDTFFLYWSRMTVGDVMADMWVPLVCLMLGCWVNRRQSAHAARMDAKALKRLRSTLIDRPAAED